MPTAHSLVHLNKKNRTMEMIALRCYEKADIS